ncbi:hypothetical protein BCY91_07050 [Pelobium manganitolerans]|uniref:Uncharacterized protein n=1 Tax=Pelobium manganitolerans TaxID=1842495 RepID=A0A419S565_9SPHI|nr:hypothetical protein BCY91_07050 [Pelobium manganitolerans]
MTLPSKHRTTLIVNKNHRKTPLTKAHKSRKTINPNRKKHDRDAKKSCIYHQQKRVKNLSTKQYAS